TMQTVHGEEYEYDALNRVVKVIYEDGSYMEYSYDSNGNIVKITMHTNKPEESDKPGEPDKSDKPEEPDKPEEQAETGTSDRPFDFRNPFGAGAAGSVGNAGIEKKDSEYRTDAKAEQVDIFTPLEPEEFTQGETEQEDTESDNSNASEAATIGHFQLVVTLFQLFFVSILQWLTQIV
ncbi:MAG: hypothetical protein K2N81_03075, partial [Acetatifactor sp.]|nr:hypothetical protein [Acetatifactor sp.]